MSLNLILTNFVLYTLGVVIVFFALHTTIFTYNNIYLIGNRYIIGLETLIASVLNIVKESIGSKEIYLPFIYSSFLFILFANLFANVPYNYAITTSAVLCIGFSVIIFLGNTILAINKHGFKFISFFLPAGTPTALIPLLFVIEIISYISRAFSLGVRLFSNIVAGHTLLVILSGIIFTFMQINFFTFLLSSLPIVIFIALIGLEIAVSFIQAYVWSTLISSYLHDAEFLH